VETGWRDPEQNRGSMHSQVLDRLMGNFSLGYFVKDLTTRRPH
jgi:hypothetical protein